MSQFAGDLRRLREKAGSPPYRELSKRAHYAASTLSDAAGGRKLPTLAVTLAYVRACEGDLAEWEERWYGTAATNRAPEPEKIDEEIPYPGLDAFGVHQAGYFFGRERLVEELSRLVTERRLLAVSGASGSGKSSLLEAGLIAGVRRSGGDRTILRLTPGPHPLRESAIQLAAVSGGSAVRLHGELKVDPAGLHLRVRQFLARRDADAELLLVVDQFEEVFTRCRTVEERDAFVAVLLHAVQEPDSRTRLVVGVRSDFIGHCGRYPALAAALRPGNRVDTGPMTAEQLRSAIMRPAIAAGHQLEGALVATIMAETAGGHGVLPLVSQAMRRTWQRPHGATLTLAAYQAAGGMTRALADTAEEVFGELDELGRQQARDVFLRLTALGTDGHDTRRRVPAHELDPAAAPVLARLIDARLVTAGADGLEFAHDALIREWPRLRSWLSTGRGALYLHRRLTEATGVWERANRDPAPLYRGSQLDEAIALAGWTRLTLREHRFLDASIQARDEETARANRSAWRLRRLAAAMVVMSGLAAASVALAVRERRQALAPCW
ncbi:nSTAND1 domain-containing NTPase [Amycolatopsis thailandensis]|uniref:nSTAND1 domain-containing NTPase n=1 Tax=Amycolatopsis thailandensis TaxID=589330 RepID=UPI00363FF87B